MSALPNLNKTTAAPVFDIISFFVKKIAIIMLKKSWFN